MKAIKDWNYFKQICIYVFRIKIVQIFECVCNGFGLLGVEFYLILLHWFIFIISIQSWKFFDVISKYLTFGGKVYMGLIGLSSQILKLKCIRFKTSWLFLGNYCWLNFCIPLMLKQIIFFDCKYIHFSGSESNLALTFHVVEDILTRVYSFFFFSIISKFIVFPIICMQSFNFRHDTWFSRIFTYFWPEAYKISSFWDSFCH